MLIALKTSRNQHEQIVMNVEFEHTYTHTDHNFTLVMETSHGRKHEKKKKCTALKKEQAIMNGG